LASSIVAATNKSPTAQTKETFKRIQQFSHSRQSANPHPSLDTANHMESAHPNKIPPSPPMHPESPTSLNIKIAAATHLPAAAAADRPFESIGV
jgi:hypothetical protein